MLEKFNADGRVRGKNWDWAENKLAFADGLPEKGDDADKGKSRG